MLNRTATPLWISTVTTRLPPVLRTAWRRKYDYRHYQLQQKQKRQLFYQKQSIPADRPPRSPATVVPALRAVRDATFGRRATVPQQPQLATADAFGQQPFYCEA